MSEPSSKQEFGKLQKWSFGMGSFAQWFINSAFTTWVFAFYFSAARLNVNYIMLAFILWTIWNAFNDPMIGHLSDRTKTRWGRRKPYIMLGTIPILIIEIILWLPPSNDQLVMFVYLLIMLVCYDTFYTMVALPYDSLFPELYTSVNERAEVNSIKLVLSSLGLVMAFLIPGLFIGEVTQREGYLVNGIVTSIIIGLSLLFSLKFGVIEREEFKLDSEEEYGFFSGLKYSLKNRSFVLYTLMFFLFEYILLLYGTLVPFYSLHVLGVTSTFMASILLGMLFIVGMIAVVLWHYLDVKLGSRKGYAIALICFMITVIPLYFISDFMLALMIFIIIGVGFGGLLYFIYLLIADVIDEDELNTGKRHEGTFFGITNFFMRLAMIFSILTISIVFNVVGWETYDPKPGIDIVNGIRLLVVLFPIIALGASLVCLYFYPYTKEYVADMKEKLAKLHTEKLEKVQKTQ